MVSTFGDQTRVRLACLACTDEEEMAFRRWVGRMPPVGVGVLRVLPRSSEAASTTAPLLEQLTAWVHEDSRGALGEDGSPARAWPAALG